MTGTLLDSLATKIDELSNTDVEWVTFVTDHIAYIKQKCSVIVIDDAIRDRYRYKFEHLMRDNGCDQRLVWIAKLINDIEMFEDFVLKSTILIPSQPYITTLYRKYQTSRNSE